MEKTFGIKVLWFRTVFALFHKVLNLEKVEDLKMNKRQAKKAFRNHEFFGVYGATDYRDFKRLSRAYWEENVVMERTEDKWMGLGAIGNHRDRQACKALRYRIERGVM